LPDTAENRKSLIGKEQSLNAVRLLANAPASESDMLVLKNRVILISFAESNPMAIVISEPELVKSYRAQLDALWDGLK
jgi:ubiquinone biosynthesis protein UbiJ